MRSFRVACSGHGSAPSHRLRGGDEHHNPENVGRFYLQKLVSEEQFKEYTRLPGGANMWFQGPSGMWYETGRNDRAIAGHYVQAALERQGRKVLVLCLPPARYTMPLVDIVVMHYLFLTTDEERAWRTSSISMFDWAGFDERAPESVKVIAQSYFGRYYASYVSNANK
jgi:hypothetical protein